MEEIGLVSGFVILALFFGIVPNIIGRAGRLFVRSRAVSHMETYIWGNVFMWAIYQALCVPMAMRGMGLTAVTRAFMGVVFACMAIIFWWDRKSFAPAAVKKSFCPGAKLKGIQLGEWIVILLILVQVCVFVFGASYIGDDSATYIATSLDAVERNQIATIDPYTGEAATVSVKQSWTSWNYYISFLSKISGVHVSAVARTFLPIFLVPMAYGVYWLIFSFLCGNDRKKIYVCMFWLNVIMMFGAYSWYSATFRLDICIWEGKAVMAVILLPFLFHYLLRIKIYGLREWAGLLVILVATCAMSLMGVGLTILIIVAAFVARNKKHTKGDVIFLLLAVAAMLVVGIVFLLKGHYMYMFTPANIKANFSAAVQMAVQADRTYWGTTGFRWFYYLCLGYLVLRKKLTRLDEVLLKYIIIQYAIIWNPIFYYIAYVFLPSHLEFERVYYTLFPELCMAYAVAIFMEKLREREPQVVCAIACAIIIIKMGVPFYQFGAFSKAENVYKIPQEIVVVCDVIIQDSAEETPKIMAVNERIAVYVRQYSSSIHQAYGRHGYGLSGYVYADNGQLIFDAINSNAVSMEEIARRMRENGCQYLIWANNAEQLAGLEAQGGTVLGGTENYAVIKLSDVAGN